VFWRRREEVLDTKTLDELIALWMRMDAKLDRILRALDEDDDEVA
jgi:hypothetical protein